MSDTNAAAGSQPSPIPPIDSSHRADARHYHVGRGGHAIGLIVVHATETKDPSNAPSLGWLTTNPTSQVSAHHLYGRDGTRYDLVARVDTAYHTGDSAWGPYHGDEGEIAVCNLAAIGHELESSAGRLGPHDPGNGYTAAQIASLAYTLACELVSYGLDPSAIVSHAQIAINPVGRRHDPAWLDWPDLMRRVAAWVLFLRAVPDMEKEKYCI